jgi:hypothetical protein
MSVGQIAGDSIGHLQKKGVLRVGINLVLWGDSSPRLHRRTVSLNAGGMIVSFAQELF